MGPSTDPRPLVGRRVSLRYRLPSGRPGARYSDAVGDLDQDGGHWLVHTRRGRVVVDPADVVAVRAVPPPRPRRAPLDAVMRLERVCARAWPAPVTEPLGDWLLRAAGGFTARGDSALAIGDPGLAVPDALAEVQRFAARHDVAPRVRLVQTTPWEVAVERAGWTVDDRAPVSVRVARLSDVAGAGTDEGTDEGADDPAGTRACPPAHPADIEIAEGPTPPWWQLVAGNTRPSKAQRAVLLGGMVGCGLARIGGEVVGAVRAALVDGWMHLARLAIDPAWRGQGLDRALAAGAGAWAQQRGARHAVLEVSLDGAAAEQRCAAPGFTEHHRYRYWHP